MALIDCHCHLDLYEDPFEVASKAAERGTYVLSVTTTPSAFERTRELAPVGSRIRTAIGMHPELVSTRAHELPLFEKYLHSTEYVGEIGIDGSKPHRDSLAIQTRVLMDILLMCASAGGRVLSMHSRGATGLVLDLLSQEPLAGTPILHWFTGSEREVHRAAALGCWFSVSARMLSSKKARDAALAMPRNRILPETDGPFGTPDREVVYPWQAMDVAEPLSALFGEGIATTQETLERNFRELVGGISRRS